ncbi:MULTISPECIES: M23 family metallopeptidase [Bacillaceae]|uniref:Peptidoglycan DD-metalloendopeptidase family protein n=1 Tax=Evansella alkalicola TaxID=745819 RepID=A0ABS6JYE1_9BACI|nr:M23 family metallopeptidase [Litchfieldia alkalitelluris]MBU9723598.1 peptidoglycan DD-metalloendopeptidase family protein [Bacillus alkalicola]
MSKKNHLKRWNIILSSGPHDSIKRISVSKRFVHYIFALIILLPFLIAGLILHINYLNQEKDLLFETIEEKEDRIGQKNKEIADIRQEYESLQEEALAVQNTIEEFKVFESRLNDLELEMPSDLEEYEDLPSGGKVFPENHGSLNEGNITGLREMKNELPKLIESFEETVNRITEYEEKLRTTPTLFPAAEGRITSHYGNRRDPFTAWTRFHSGTDIAAPLNTPIYTAADGTVVHAGNNGGYGLTVIVKHSDTYETLYAHLNEIYVEVGDQVRKGDEIGGMGTTGRSTGVHLHYEIFRNGEQIDPYLYMTFHERDTED